MDILGTIYKKPSQKSNGKWDYVYVEYEGDDEFNEGTSKIMNILYKKNAEGKCYVKDTKNNIYDLDIIHATFDIVNQRISVYPLSCSAINNKNQNINQNNNKKSN